MAAFPYYDTTALDALNGQAEALLNQIGRAHV